MGWPVIAALAFVSAVLFALAEFAAIRQRRRHRNVRSVLKRGYGFSRRRAGS